MANKKMRDAANSLAAELFGEPWYQGVAIVETGDDPHIQILTKRKPRMKQPTEWQGFKVVVQNIGQIRPL